MALIERYFAVSASGSGDGSSVANAAALFDGSGNWSSVITGFDFSANGLRCHIMPGAYTCAQSLTTSITSVADPTAPLPLILHGAAADGSLLTPPDPNWQSCQPAFDTAAGWDETDWPVIATTTNIVTVNMAHTYLRLISFTASGRTGGGVIQAAGGIDWCSIVSSSDNANARALTATFVHCANSVLSCTADNYDAVLAATNSDSVDNVRCVGNLSSGGLRHGCNYSGTTTQTVFSRLTCILNSGAGWAYTGTSTGVNVKLIRCVFANNIGSGVLFPDTAAQTSRSYVDRCMITGNGAYGIDPGGANTNLVVTHCRLRDNTSGNFGTFGNYPTDLDNNVTDSDDASEYVDATNGDYRIKAAAAIWGKGYGVADEAQPTLPPVNSVWSESDTYGYASGQLSGTMQWDDIANLTPANVRAGVVIGNENFTGELVLPTEAQVESGVEYGAAAEFVGTYAGASGTGGGSLVNGGLVQ